MINTIKFSLTFVPHIRKVVWPFGKLTERGYAIINTCVYSIILLILIHKIHKTYTGFFFLLKLRNLATEEEMIFDIFEGRRFPDNCNFPLHANIFFFFDNSNSYITCQHPRSTTTTAATRMMYLWNCNCFNRLPSPRRRLELTTTTTRMLNLQPTQPTSSLPAADQLRQP